MAGNGTQSTILVVDDDRGLLRLIEKALKSEGFATATAASGSQALAWLGDHQAALMLLDLKLQDLEGKDLIHWLAESNRCPPFIIITGQGDERVAVDMMKRGAIDYLVKDVNFLQFVPSVVKRALEQVDRERRLAEAEEQRRRLEQEILEISDRERQRIGQDLHDGLCQQLAGIELMSQVLEQKLARKSKVDATRAGEIARHVREAISQTRSLAQGLSPVTLEAEGLMAALHELAANTEKIFGVACRFVCEEPVLIANQAVATHFFRIAQEAVSNAIKHGKAARLLIGLKQADKRILLSVSDDGAGFPQPLANSKGMGLHIMRYRAAMVGGQLVLENSPKGGALVSCSVPVEINQQPAPKS